jgi:hypothetical protein
MSPLLIGTIGNDAVIAKATGTQNALAALFRFALPTSKGS